MLSLLAQLRDCLFDVRPPCALPSHLTARPSRCRPKRALPIAGIVCGLWRAQHPSLCEAVAYDDGFVTDVFYMTASPQLRDWLMAILEELTLVRTTIIDLALWRTARALCTSWGDVRPWLWLTC